MTQGANRIVTGAGKDEPTLTDQEAEEMLLRLGRHFRQPVLPIQRYCASLYTWRKALCDRAHRARYALWPGIDKELGVYARSRIETATAQSTHDTERTPRDHAIQELGSFKAEADAAERTFFSISKSNLLLRLLYQGEALRTRMCPDHKGRWQGIDFDGTGCSHGCQLTGWIAEPSEIIVTGEINVAPSVVSSTEES